MTIKKVLISTALVMMGASSAYAAASDPKVTLGGSLNTQLGWNGQKSVFNTENYSSAALAPNAGYNKLHKYALVNDTKLHIKVDGSAHGMKYGGKITFNADTSRNKYSLVEDENNVGYQTMVYVESKMGRLEGGSTTGVYDAMKVNGGSIGRATGGISGDTRWWWNQDFARGLFYNRSEVAAVTVGPVYTVTTKATVSSLGSFITAPSLPTNYDENKVANAAKLSYMTPSFSGFKAGVSYIFDTDQSGTVTNFHNVARNRSALPVSSDFQTYRNNLRTSGFKNVFQGGIHYTGKYDKAQFKFAALGEMGKAKDISLIENTQTAINGLAISRVLTPGYNLKRHNLRAWEVGASLWMNGFTLAGSYGDWGKSGLIKSMTNNATPAVTTEIGGKKTAKYWTAGIGYDYKNVGASLTYMNSSAGGFGTNLIGNKGYSGAKGKFDMFSVGLDYKLAPGFMPYAEVSHFTMKDKSEMVKGAAKNSGNIVLAGTKLHF